ncbi:hypothetical protein BCR36DRAFT_373775 [Piromyces finnis]|uniref:Uncharacterized protein n=1 Tax=Piromyces finnis TaxID=1754191 RepID=A0A1Y1V070_9FUNG|nr:hypothetical protein BCR36DRAFT_373775 [Piromyces finnis]|eukprot:ORX43622.1 hypothetical protein BCR36DRAFT_373775 [Piromyces finnis]
MAKKTISRRDSLMPYNDYIYPDFKKCKTLLFTLVFFEYLNILILTYYNFKKNFLSSKSLGIIFFFEFLGLIFVVLALRSLNKKKWRKGKKVILFFSYLIIHIGFYTYVIIMSCIKIWAAYNKKGNMGPKFTLILYTILSSILVVGQIIYFLIFLIYTKNTWRSGDESLV